MKNILVIRLDNMGDVLMSTPAVRALKEHFGAAITLLTSAAGASIAAHIPVVDAIITWEAPWVKGGDGADIGGMAARLAAMHFDAAVIFTVCTQNPLPAAMLAFMAGIPIRAAYCRENPYALLTHWIPDAEPYETLRHQVLRDLSLAASLGAGMDNEDLSLQSNYPHEALRARLKEAGVDTDKPYIVLNCGVSEAKRKYPAASWDAVAREIVATTGMQVICTGMPGDVTEAQRIAGACGPLGFSLAGRLPMEVFLSLVKHAALVLTANTGPAHIAAALGTPVVVAYAKTNPQHTPWNGISSVLYFDVPLMINSRNLAVRFVGRKYFSGDHRVATPENMVAEALRLLRYRDNSIAESITCPNS
ncbi:glycosyltransferase family 9 protein [Chitinophaga sp. NPDC101104]|uniref:glycosyltransferase family 9 protein n=1 Tax=Chitinophaga sp. NPDC101104 TaxID=3390561 RepID=UPI003CFEBD0C